jgi:hypothetical protein
VEPSQFFRRRKSTVTPMEVRSAAGSRWRPSSGEPKIVSGRFSLLPSGAAPVAVGLPSKWAYRERVRWVCARFPGGLWRPSTVRRALDHLWVYRRTNSETTSSPFGFFSDACGHLAVLSANRTSGQHCHCWGSGVGRAPLEMQKLQGKAKPSRIRRLTDGGAATRRLPGRAQSIQTP